MVNQKMSGAFSDCSKRKEKPIITAYKNGKRLTTEEAKALYNKVQKHRVRMSRQLQRFQRRMKRWYHHEMENMQSFFMPLPSTQLMQPVVIIEHDNMGKKGNVGSSSRSRHPKKMSQDKLAAKGEASSPQK